jgi:hypothetical protein
MCHCAETCRTRRASRRLSSNALIGGRSALNRCRIAKPLTPLVNDMMNGSRVRLGNNLATGPLATSLVLPLPKERNCLLTRLCGTRHTLLACLVNSRRASSSVARCEFLLLGKHLLKRELSMTLVRILSLLSGNHHIVLRPEVG